MTTAELLDAIALEAPNPNATVYFDSEIDRDSHVEANGVFIDQCGDLIIHN